MIFPDRETVARVRKEYPEGTRVILQRMEDPMAPPVGTMGTVVAVDDSASLIMKWDNGSGLNVVYGEDYVKKMVMTDKEFQQIMNIRSSGVVNMLSVREVQKIAYDQGFYELVCYIEDEPKRYFHFIMFGTED